MSRYISDLRNIGVPVDDDIKKYVGTISPTAAACSSSRIPSSTWIDYIGDGHFMNETILLGGLLHIDFPFGTIISHPNTSERILRIGTNAKADLNVWAADISKRFARLTSRGALSNILVLMDHKLHWGIVIVEDRKIFWADSLRSKPFGTCSHTVLDVMKLDCEKLFPKDQWVIQRKSDGDYCNYMLDVLNFEKQRDDTVADSTFCPQSVAFQTLWVDYRPSHIQSTTKILPNYTSQPRLGDTLRG